MHKKKVEIQILLEALGCSKKYHNHYRKTSTTATISNEYNKYCSQQ